MFEATAELMRNRSKTGAERAIDEAGLSEFRRELDGMLEWQVYDAPGDIVERLVGKRALPPRRFSIIEVLFTRQQLTQKESGIKRDVVAKEIKQEVKEVETRAGNIPPSQSNPCRVCKSATPEGSSIRCSKVGHADVAVRAVSHSDKVMNKLIFICSECQSERLTSADGGDQAAGDIPNSADGRHVGLMCGKCYKKSKYSSAILDNQAQGVQPVRAAGAPSDPTMVQILRTLQELQQGQRELQQQQLEMKTILNAHIQKVQRQPDINLRSRVNEEKDVAEELRKQTENLVLQRQVEEMELMNQYTNMMNMEMSGK